MTVYVNEEVGALKLKNHKSLSRKDIEWNRRHIRSLRKAFLNEMARLPPPALPHKDLGKCQRRDLYNYADRTWG